jgi:hypothetical protein
VPPSPVFDPGEGTPPIQGVPTDVGNENAGGTRTGTDGTDEARDAGLGLADAGDAGSSDAGMASDAGASPSRSPSASGGGPDAGLPRSEADAGTSANDADARTPLPSAPLPSAPCPGVVFAGSCYQFFAEQLSWAVAEARCVSWGGHLASVESSDEDAFLGAWPALVGIAFWDGSGLWLGGTDAQTDGDFRWSGDRALTFVGWAPDQPNDGQGVDCIEKRNDVSQRWYDRRCTDGERFVCERPQ